MKIKFSELLKITFIFFFIFNFGCSEEDSDGGSNIPSIGDGPINGVPVGQVEGTGFWVTASSKQYSIYVNSDEGFGTNCFIDATETTNKNMHCFIDILEGDLYLYDLAIQYNAPPNLCDQVRITPNWFWNYSTGTGPSSVTLNVDTSSDNPTVTTCDTFLHDGTPVACSAHPELFDDLNPRGPKCVYDLSSVDGANCCLGDYRLTITNDDGAGGVTTTVSDTSWGGSVSSCIGGPIKNNWTIFSTAGYPGSMIIPVPKTSTGATVGLNGAIELRSPAMTSRAFFSEYANFYETTGNPHAHRGYEQTAPSDEVNVPYAVDPVDDIDGSPIVAGSDAFVISCLDSGWEIKHQIRTYIREWNTAVDFIAYATSEGVAYNPHQQGTEGVDCDYSGTFGSACNDLVDFTDILTSVGGTYTLDNANPLAPLIRSSYFPNINYP